MQASKRRGRRYYFFLYSLASRRRTNDDGKQKEQKEGDCGASFFTRILFSFLRRDRLPPPHQKTGQQRFLSLRAVIGSDSAVCQRETKAVCVCLRRPVFHRGAFFLFFFFLRLLLLLSCSFFDTVQKEQVEEEGRIKIKSKKAMRGRRDVSSLLGLLAPPPLSGGGGFAISRKNTCHFPPLDRTGPRDKGSRSRNVRSRCRCSLSPAIRISSRGWPRSSSTDEPSDPPSRVCFWFCFFFSF